MLDTIGELLTAPLDALNWLTDQLFLLLNALFDRFGTPIVFVAALTEATAGLGAIFPGVALMFLGGAYAGGDWSTLVIVYVLAVSGTMIGDTLSYTGGRWGSRLLAGTRFSRMVRLGEALMSGGSRWLIPFYHLHNVTRALGPFGSGAIRMPVRVWMPLDYAGALLANLVWVGGGAVFGSAVLTDDGRLKEHPALRLGLVVAAALWFLLLQRQLMRRWRELSGEEEAIEQPLV